MAQRGKKQETSVWAAVDTQPQAQVEQGRRGAARLGGSGSRAAEAEHEKGQREDSKHWEQRRGERHEQNQVYGHATLNTPDPV